MNVDSLDLQVWDQQFGQVEAVTVAVPEPIAWLLLLIGYMGTGRIGDPWNR